MYVSNLGNAFVATKKGNAEEQPDARRGLYTIVGDRLLALSPFYIGNALCG
jgi:hypothetical protein